MKKNISSVRLKKLVWLVFLIALWFIHSSNIAAQNSIEIENSLSGNPSSEWDIEGAGDLSIQGFATDISVNKGNTIHFKIKTDANDYTIQIYRIGYYQGNGARLVANGTITASLPQVQPADLYDPVTGLVDCGNWSESAHWDVPVNAVSGIYIAKLTRTDNNGSSHIVFVVRDDASTSDIYFQTSDATWQAYNVYGGNSLYVGSTSYPSGHATKVSYNRPFVTRNGGGGGGEAEDWLFNAEYPMIRWLEKNGYDVTYTTCVDADRYGSLILNHRVFLSVGHDEYWSGQQRANVEAARDAGIHLAFFSGNEIYWKTRWEESIDTSTSPYRTLVCYKEGTLGENCCGTKCDPMVNEWTGLWRDGCDYPGADGCLPENSLSGQISWDGTTGAIEVPYIYKNLRFWNNTDIAELDSGETITLTNGSLGYEWDWDQYHSSSPIGKIHLSSTLLNTHHHHLSLYRHTSGALVFGAGTVQWSWGLDGNHDRGGSVPDINMQQATVNLFADMNVQPTTLQPELIPATTSVDIIEPVSTITSPSNGIILMNGVSISITGTATDNMTIAGIEISVDNGVTWQMANGTNNWTYTFIPIVPGPVTIKSRAFDDSGNIEAEGFSPSANVIVDTVSVGTPVTCPCSIFLPTDAPTIPLANDGQPIELGVKFQSNENGFITALRFYKGAGTTGTHLGHLWNSSGVMLTEVTFIAESASGWQEVALSTPVAITSNTTYIAACFSSSGDYSYSDFSLVSPIVHGPLTALSDGQDGPNGVYQYGSSPVFPIKHYQSSNYWIDVVFSDNIGPDTLPPTISSILPINNATQVNINSSINVFFSEAIDPSTLNANSFELRDSSGTLINANIVYNAALHKAILTPVSPLTYLTFYQVKVKGGTGYYRIKDFAGNAMLTDYNWSFTTSAPPPIPGAEGHGGPILLISDISNPFSRYPIEILQAEGFNEYLAMDITQVNSGLLNNYDVIIVGEIPLTPAHIIMLTDWTNNGGTLIAFKPDTQLATLLGIIPTGSTLADKYLLVNTASTPGNGIVNQTIQYHGTSDLYTLNGATSLATLYSSTSTPTPYPAVTIHSVGANGGQAIAFTYDLARSIIYTRQGNPEWANQKRDGQPGPIRSDDQFFPDWVDMNKIAIPQADEQQHLLSNIILQSNLHRKPIPRIWFLPKGLKSAIVMTGDNHGDNGMQPRFDLDIAMSTPGCSVNNWECIRSTGYLYVGSSFTDSMANYYSNLGFEVALHVNTNCMNVTESEYQNMITTQLADFTSTFSSIPSPSTNRNHCIAWSGWSMTPEKEAENGMRLDVNYYYWPDTWVANQPGMFTGSGMPMRFAKTDGTIIDCYQVVTQMPDESGESFPSFCDALLDKALGPEGYYGVFATNMHFDQTNHTGANSIVASAQAHNIPVVSAKQMLDWLDGRNNSFFGPMIWNNHQLSFSIIADTNARNMKAMLPIHCEDGILDAITYNGTALVFNIETIKGIEYAFFNGTMGTGNYIAFYTPEDTITTTLPCFVDQTVIDFNQGVDTNTVIISEGDGAILLQPSIVEEFTGNSVPLNWIDAIWDSQPGAFTTYSAGQVMVNGTHLYTSTSFGPGSAVEFSATFSSGNFQNIGFTGDGDFNNPWIVIGRGAAGDNHVYARTSDAQVVSLGTNLLDAPHIYRIQWNTISNNFEFYVDSDLVATPSITQTVNTNMLVHISDYPSGGPGLIVDWIKVTPYSTPGSFTSRIFDGGSNKYWGAANWTANIPPGTTLQISARMGNTPIPDVTWTPYLSIPSSGDTLGGISRYIQYKVDLSTTNPHLSAILYDIAFNCTEVNDTSLSIITQPASQSTCIGSHVTFISHATGFPTPVVQWQLSSNLGATWSNISLANTDTFQFSASVSDTNNLYRALWTNGVDTLISTSVLITMNETPNANITAFNTTICAGQPIQLQLNSAIGQSPYSIVVNDSIYTNVSVGDIFETIEPMELSIWGDAGLPSNPDVSDGVPIEVGTKFKSSANGYITGIRFYKGTNNNGTHIASLWTRGGSLLSSTPFTAETINGWQEVHFATPVYINSDSVYIASYYSPNGGFAITPNYFSGGDAINPPLTALQAGIEGPNGVYIYGGGFPTNGNTANYWVDVLFLEEPIIPQTFHYVLSSISDASGCNHSADTINMVSVTVNPLPNGTLQTSGATCQGENINLIFNSSSGTGPFEITINDSTYSNIIDGQPFSIGANTSNQTISIWDNSIIPGTPSVNIDSAAIELGVKFKSDIGGKITGIRFYKGANNIGTHTGTLWSSGGVMLATATFTDETTSGWQEVLFSNSVNITANTTYIASYHAEFGRYAFDQNYFSASGVNSGPLRALQEGEQGPNGVYKYGNGGTFPNESFSSSNYWVDVLFNTSDSATYTLDHVSDANNCGSINTNSSVIVVSHPSYMHSSSTSICSSDSILIGGIYRSTAGIYNDTLNNIFGCDSIISVALTILPDYIQNSNIWVCTGSNYTFPDGTIQNNIIATTIYTSSLQTIHGCDSNIVTTVNVYPDYNQNVSAWVCNGSNYTFPDGTVQNNIIATTIYTSSLQTIHGCDSNIVTTVNVYPDYNQNISAWICAGNNYTFPDGTIQNNITSTATHISNLQTLQGCDSIIFSTVNINPVYNSVDSVWVCFGGSYIFPDGTLQLDIESPVTHTSHLISTNGCDSIITTGVHLSPYYNISDTSWICSGESYTFPDGISLTNILVNITHTSNLNTYEGCDSNIITLVNIYPTYSTSDSSIICSGDDFIFADGTIQTNITSITVHTSNFISMNGCDSTITTTLHVNLLPSVTFNIPDFGDTLCMDAIDQPLTGGFPFGGIYSGTGVIGSTFSPTTVGLGAYDIIYTYSDSNMCSNSAVYTVVVDSCSSLSIHESGSEIQLLVYPNPTTGEITLQSNINLGVIIIYDFLGKIVYHEKMLSEKEKIDISLLAAGPYILNVHGKNFRLIKQ